MGSFGTCLSPVLFKILINDLETICNYYCRGLKVMEKQQIMRIDH